jgi:hypothetical protein
MTNIHLNQLYSCDNQHFYKKINCKHWSYNKTACDLVCSLKNINPSEKDCRSCSDRDPVDLNIKDIKILSKVEYSPNPTESKIRSYAKAEVSQFTQGKVSEEIFNKRKEHCMSCERRKNPHPEGESIGWCTSCGCGITPRAALSQKLYIPTISCPLNKFGPEKGEGFNAKDAIDSVKGIATSVKSLFEKDK